MKQKARILSVVVVMASLCTTETPTVFAGSSRVDEGSGRAATSRRDVPSRPIVLLAEANITSQNLVTNQNVNIGSQPLKVWEAPLEVKTRAVKLRSVTFRVTGNLPTGVITKVGLYVDSASIRKTEVTPRSDGSLSVKVDATSLSSDFLINPGQHKVTVYISITKGANTSFNFALQDGADFELYDTEIGSRVVVGTSTTGALPSIAGTLSINPGFVSLIKDPSLSENPVVYGGAQSAVIGRYTLRAINEEERLSSLALVSLLSIYGKVPNQGLQNVALFLNGTQIGGTLAQLGSNEVVIVGFDQPVAISTTQDSTLEIRADVKTAGGDPYTSGSVTTAIASGFSNSVGADSRLTLSVPQSTIVGDTLIITSPQQSVTSRASIRASR